MPGEYIDTDHPEGYGPPWTEDAEADAAVRKAHEEFAQATRDLESAAAADGLSVAPVAPEGPSLTVQPDGEITNEAGQVVGHVNPPSA